MSFGGRKMLDNIKLDNFKIIDARNLSSDELQDILKNNGLSIKTVPKEESVNKRNKRTEKTKSLRPQKPLCEYTREDTIIAKECDIQEIYSDLDLIYDFNKGKVNLLTNNFTSRHGAAVHSLSPHDFRIKGYDDQMVGRTAAFEYVMNNVMPDGVVGNVREVTVTELHKEIEKITSVENHKSESRHYKEDEQKKDIWDEKFTYITGGDYFTDEVVRARTIREAYDCVMAAGNEEDMLEAQEMMDKYTSIFSDDLNVVLAYEPHVEREIEDRVCDEAKNSKVFKSNDEILLIVPNSWTKRRDSIKGEFDTIKFPFGFSIGQGSKKVDLSGFGFNYSVQKDNYGKDTNVSSISDGKLRAYKFSYSNTVALAKSVRNSTGTGWDKEYINAVSIKDLIKGVEEYTQEKLRYDSLKNEKSKPEHKDDSFIASYVTDKGMDR